MNFAGRRTRFSSASAIPVARCDIAAMLDPAQSPLHDWRDEQAVQILGNVRAAAGPGAVVLLVELVIPRHDRDFPGKWADLEMLLNLGSRERTADEYRDLLGRTAFRTTRVVRTASPLSLVEARPG